MKRIRILQVGFRHDHAKPTFESLLRLQSYFEVVGLCDDDLSGARERIPNAPAYFTVEEALMLDIDAVAVECEEERATALAQRFANRGVHVHLDKPASPSYEAFCRLADTLEKQGCVFQMGYMYRYNPAVMDAIARVKRGALGEVFSVEAQMSVRHDKEKRAWLSRFRGGMTYFLGCHLIDLILQIQGMPDAVIPMNASTETDGICSADFGFVILKYARGVSFARACAAEYGGFARRQLVIAGAKGTLALSPLEILDGELLYTSVSATLEENGPPVWGDGAVRGETPRFNRYDGMMEAFARYICGEEENPYTYAYEKQLFAVLMEGCGI